MAKQGQHKNDAFDQRKSPGNNHPDRSQTITTGSSKKQETIEQDAREHRDPYRQAQEARNDWNPDRRDQDRSANRGSQTGAQAVAAGDAPEDFQRDLNPDPLAGQNHGLHRSGDSGPSAYDMKDVHQLWRGLSNTDLKQIPVLEEGTRLEQGATYLDLNDPQRGEIRALGNMEAGPTNRYVAKSAVDYQLWNALIGVETPERLGAADEG
jgi:hypothetical protein